MTAEQFMASLAKLRKADALAELDGFLAAIDRWRDNPSVGVVEIAMLRRERERLAKLR